MFWAALVSSLIKNLKNEAELVAVTLADLKNLMWLSV
jgi:hypothetical protein